MKIKLLPLTLIIIIISFKISWSQNGIDSLFFNLRLNQCVEKIIESIENDRNFVMLKSKYTLSPNSIFVNNENKYFKEDSLSIIISKEITGFFRDSGIIKLQKVTIERHYNDIRKAHNGYNMILSKLLLSGYADFFVRTGFGSNDNSIIFDTVEKNAHICDTGICFTYSGELHKITLLIEYSNDDSYTLSLSSELKRIKCN